MTDEQWIVGNPRVVYRDLAAEEGGVLLHLDSGQYHGLNALGSMIWHLLEDGKKPSALVSELRGRLETLPPQLDEDVAGFHRQPTRA